MNKKSMKLPNNDWVYNYSKTLADTLNQGIDQKTAIEIACIMVSVRMDLEPYIGRLAALKTVVTVSKALGKRFQVSVDVDYSLVPSRLQVKARKYLKAIS